MSVSYEQFIKEKVVFAKPTGFEISLSEINPLLKLHQQLSVQWMVRGGRRALFANFGLGKSLCQLEALRIVLKHLGGGRALIVAPLGVRQEFKRDAALIGLDIKFVRTSAEITDDGLYITNYESVRMGKIDVHLFDAVSLDECSIFRSMGGTKTFREFMALFAGDRKTLNTRVKTKGVPYRFLATATPSPNDYIELTAYAAFLDIMTISESKTRFFKRDSTKADKLTIHPHKQREFWLWCNSWALFLQSPSNINCSDEGYELPPMDVIFHKINVNHNQAGMDKSGQVRMFRNAAIGLSEAAREKRESLPTRICKMQEILLNDRENQKRKVQRILRSQQRRITCEAKSPQCGELSTEQREIQAADEGMESSQSGKIPKNVRPLQIGEQGQSQQETAGILPKQQTTGERTESRQQIEEIWVDSRAVQSNEGTTEQCLPYLQNSTATIGSGSLSFNGQSPRTLVQGLQYSSRSVSRESGDSSESDFIFDQWVIWCTRNDEQRAIERTLEKAGISYSSVDGSQSVEEKENQIEAWRSRQTTVLLSKPIILGSGVNLQQSHKAIFVGIDYKFNDFTQACKRQHRFLQNHPVEIHIIYAESEQVILETLLAKWERDKNQRQIMSDIIKTYGLNEDAMKKEMTRSMGCERMEIRGANHKLVHNDCVLETQSMDANSVDLILTSIPFSTQYEYSPSFNDFGHSDNNEQFFKQMDFLTPELLRVLQPGRIAAIHVKDRIVPGGMTGLGFQTVYPFHCRTIEHYVKHGFAYMGMKTIVTDVVRENNQTYRLGWTEQCKDGSKMGVGMPEYLLLFRKPPTETINSYADVPVVKSKEKYSRSRWQIDAHGFARSSGNRLLMPEDLKGVPHDTIFKLFRNDSLNNIYDFERHVAIGEDLDADKRLPVTFMLLQPQSWSDEVWTDITRMRTLNGAQSAKGRELHICPLQFDIIDRVVEQFSMEGETVFDPFNGIGSTVYRALLKRRKGIGVELSRPYFLDSIAYCQAAEIEIATPSLFDLIEMEETQMEAAAA